MAVPIQISLPLSDAVDGLIDQNQLAVVPLMTSDSMERTSVLGEEDEVVEDWVSDTCLEDVAQSNGRCFLPLSVEPLLSLCHWVAWITSVKGRKMLVWKVRWVKNITQSGSKVEFDDFLGTSLKGLE